MTNLEFDDSSRWSRDFGNALAALFCRFSFCRSLRRFSLCGLSCLSFLGCHIFSPPFYFRKMFTRVMHFGMSSEKIFMTLYKV